MGDKVIDLAHQVLSEGNDPVGQALQRPVLPPFRRCTARFRDQPGLSFLIQLGSLTRARAFLKRLKAALDKVSARAFNRRSPNPQRFGDSLVGPAFSSFE
jgi:hypothetical protein